MECTRTESEIEDFDELVRAYWKPVYRFILASVRNADAARSLTQDCFMRSHQGREAFRGESSVKTWLMKIAINLARDYRRNRRIQFWKRVSDSSPDLSDISGRIPAALISPEHSAVLNEQVGMIWLASRRLPAKQRTVFLLRFVEDMDLLDIASATGMKEGTVKLHLFRAIRTIRKRLGSLR
jgi:RNA polymerase sigma-70 factor (ECF subfamily)